MTIKYSDNYATNDESSLSDETLILSSSLGPYNSLPQISTLESFGAIKVRISVGNKTLSKKKFDGPIHLKTTILQLSFLYENSTIIKYQNIIKHYSKVKKMYKKLLKKKNIRKN
tara:strand:+ start:175 stop:516 length:342 start_codon:yes stop_codon:yes gene_type:complete